MLAELEKAVGPHGRLATERRVARLEAALKPMFGALPKDSAGNLGPASVRYLLHRLFVQRHGWFVNGLENGGDSWNTSSPTKVFKDHAEDVHSVFEDKLSAKGFSLQQVALFAATLENLVHLDSIERLHVAYSMTGFSHTESSLSEANVDKVINAYMIMFVLSLDHNNVTHDDFVEAANNIMDVYPTWPDTELFAKEVRNSVLADVSGSERTSWNSTLKVLEEVGERYGRWQDTECRSLKRTLVGMSNSRNGRVTLDRFYGNGLTDSTWMFMESVPYLRQLGALDETDPQRMSVIIPNYVNSPSNCVASSKFYSVCCIDECEALLGTLEERIAAPEASPELITQIVTVLPSETETAPRVLPDALTQRLSEVAAHHGGLVPLHGRLFAQWMHHAYPHECPYPHVSGTTNPVTANMFVQMTGEEVEVTHDQIENILEQTKKYAAAPSNDVAALPWTIEEELFVHGGHHVRTPATFANYMSKFVWLVVAISLASSIVKVFQKTCVGNGKLSDSKYYV